MSVPASPELASASPVSSPIASSNSDPQPPSSLPVVYSTDIFDENAAALTGLSKQEALEKDILKNRLGIFLVDTLLCDATKVACQRPPPEPESVQVIVQSIRDRKSMFFYSNIPHSSQVAS